MQANAVMIHYGMGITQHKYGVDTIKMIVNLLLLRGNIGKPGAGISPVRGHSNVQGQRTVGISEKTKLVPLDKLKELYGFEPPHENGFSTVDACQAVQDGKVRGFIELGGNFVRAIPERELMEKVWAKLRLTVHVATKLNRSHLNLKVWLIGDNQRAHGAPTPVPCLWRQGGNVQRRLSALPEGDQHTPRPSSMA
jgi:anaerobic selenocysteine-containing dehydrogenase